MKFITKLLIKLNGWKRIVGYVLLNIPFISGNPLLYQGIKDFLNNPNIHNAINAMAHLLLAVGVAHGVIKKVKE